MAPLTVLYACQSFYLLPLLHQLWFSHVPHLRVDLCSTLYQIQTDADFLDYQIISRNKQQVIIHRENEMFAVHWQIKEKIVITLCQHD